MFIIARFTDAMAMILGDVTYGACCIDDLSGWDGKDFLLNSIGLDFQLWFLMTL